MYQQLNGFYETESRERHAHAHTQVGTVRFTMSVMLRVNYQTMYYDSTIQ